MCLTGWVNHDPAHPFFAGLSRYHGDGGDFPAGCSGHRNHDNNHANRNNNDCRNNSTHYYSYYSGNNRTDNGCNDNRYYRSDNNTGDHYHDSGAFGPCRRF
jgi:hypothetical protein